MSNNNTDALSKRTLPVSVVVPCYRCSDTIGRAVASIDAQTFRPQEIFLIDDASGDDTLTKLYELQQHYGVDWIKIISLPLNAGASSARNVGWNLAMGDYIAFLDADDAWHPRKLEIQHSFMSRHPDYVLTGHGHRWVTEFPTQHGSVERVRHKMVSYYSLLLSNRFITPSVMLKRNVSLRFCEKKRHMEDFLLWLEIAASGKQLAWLDCDLAYIFKAPFGESGLSADIFSMEKGELHSYWRLHQRGLLGLPLTAILLIYSCLKFLRRISMLSIRRSRYLMPERELKKNRSRD